MSCFVPTMQEPVSVITSNRLTPTSSSAGEVVWGRCCLWEFCRSLSRGTQSASAQAPETKAEVPDRISDAVTKIWLFPLAVYICCKCRVGCLENWGVSNLRGVMRVMGCSLAEEEEEEEVWFWCMKKCNKNTGVCGECSSLYIENTINRTAFLPCSSSSLVFWQRSFSTISSVHSALSWSLLKTHFELLSVPWNLANLQFRILNNYHQPGGYWLLRCSSSTCTSAPPPPAASLHLIWLLSSLLLSSSST